jgi:hypothetical protein
MSNAGTVSGVASAAASASKGAFLNVGVVYKPIVTPFGTTLQPNFTFSNPLRSTLDKFFSGPAGTVLGAAAVVLGTYGLAKSVSSVYKNGITPMGALGIGASTFGLATGINMLLHAGMLTNPAGWFAAGAVISASLTFESVQDMFQNGISAKGVVTAAATTFATAVLAEAAVLFMAPALLAAVPLIGPFIALGVLAFSLIWGYFHQKPSEEIAAMDANQQASLLWTAGPMVLVAGGTIAALMGFSPKSAAPVMAGLTVPSYYLTQAVQNHLLPSSVPMNSQTPSLIVEPTSGEVVIVSPTSNGQASLTSYALAQNLQFVSSATAPQDSYIPFFIYDGNTAKVNPAAVKGIGTQVNLLKAALSDNLTTQESMNAVAIASAANKSDVSVGS